MEFPNKEFTNKEFINKLIEEEDEKILLSAYLFINHISKKKNFNFYMINDIFDKNIRFNVDEDKKKFLINFLEKMNNENTIDKNNELRYYCRNFKEKGEGNLRFFRFEYIKPIDEIFLIYSFMKYEQKTKKEKSKRNKLFGNKVQISSSTKMDNKKKNIYKYYWNEYKEYNSCINKYFQKNDNTLVINIDIKDFYNNIRIDDLKECIGNDNDKFQVNIKKIYFQNINNVEDAKGLSPLFIFSGYLATILMQRILNEIEDAIGGININGFEIFAYVDDMTILVSDELDRYKELSEEIIDKVSEVLDNYNLELNDSKTRIQVVGESYDDIDYSSDYIELPFKSYVDFEKSFVQENFKSSDLESYIKSLFIFVRDYQNKIDQIKEKSFICKIFDDINKILNEIKKDLSIFFMCTNAWPELIYLDMIYKVYIKNGPFKDELKKYINTVSLIDFTTKEFKIKYVLLDKTEKEAIKVQMEINKSIAEKLYQTIEANVDNEVPLINIFNKFISTPEDFKAYKSILFFYGYEETLMKLLYDKDYYTIDKKFQVINNKIENKKEKYSKLEVAVCSLSEKVNNNYYEKFLEEFNNNDSVDVFKQEEIFEEEFINIMNMLMNKSIDVAFFPEHSVPAHKLMKMIDMYKPKFDIICGLTPYCIGKVVYNTLLYIKYNNKDGFIDYEIEYRTKIIFSDAEEKQTEKNGLELYRSEQKELLRISIKTKNDTVNITPLMCYEITDLSLRLGAAKGSEIVSIHSHNKAESHFEVLSKSLCLDWMVNVIGCNHSQFGGVFIHEPKKNHDKVQMYLKNRHYSSVLYARIDFGELKQARKCDVGKNKNSCDKIGQDCKKCKIRKYKNKPPHL